MNNEIQPSPVASELKQAGTSFRRAGEVGGLACHLGIAIHRRSGESRPKRGTQFRSPTNVRCLDPTARLKPWLGGPAKAVGIGNFAGATKFR